MVSDGGQGSGLAEQSGAATPAPPAALRAWWPAWFGAGAGFVIGVVLFVFAPMLQPPTATEAALAYLRLVYVVLFFGSAAGMFVLRRGVLAWAPSITVGLIVSYFIRVWLDSLKDPTGHNLLGLEILFMLVVFGVISLAGGGFGMFVRSYAERDSAQSSYARDWRKRPK
ncbi:MAG: hypothetical protein ABJE47_17945 [bacterium]